MSNKDELSAFVRTALQSDRSRPEIAVVLRKAGWSQAETDDALSGWADVGFLIPVPSPKSVVSARDFFVHGLTFVMLVASACYLNWLLFKIIDLLFGDPEYAYWMANAIRSAIAGLVVTAPLYVWLTLREERLAAANPGRSRSAIRNWLLYLTLLLTALTFLGDLVWTLARFLNGELTLVTALRCGVVAVISGAIFLFYLRKTKGTAS
jgi:hypothetical protein